VPRFFGWPEGRGLDLDIELFKAVLHLDSFACPLYIDEVNNVD